MSNYVEIEVKARTVDLAVEAAMRELGVDDREMLAVEVIAEPVKGFLGFGGQDAVVRVRRKKGKKRGGRRRKSGAAEASRPKQDKEKSSSHRRSAPKPAKNGAAGRAEKPEKKQRPERKEKPVSDDRPQLTIEDQAQIAKEFLEGLVGAYGLEGEVTAVVDDGAIVADVSGEQTEALVGVRGSVRSAIHELTRTVLQRHGKDTASLRLDIAGYGERRRQALSIYAEQLIEQLMAEGGEIMLEPMSPADRKVIHDAATAHEGVSSYSEGEPPRRFVVLSLDAAATEEE